MSEIDNSKWKPNLVKKRTIVSLPNVSHNPNQHLKVKTTKDLIKLNKSKPNVDLNKQAVTHNKLRLVSDIRKKNKGKLKRVKTIYQSKDPSPDSLSKIRALKNVGQGRILVIIANGPSISELDLTKLVMINNIDIMSINKPDPRLWPTTYWAFYDTSQYRRHRELISEYKGYILNSTAIVNVFNSKAMQFKNLGEMGFSLNAEKGIHIGRSSVYASMQVAHHMNYDKTFIFGCDMNPDGIGGKLHFYGDNPDVDPNVRGNRFKKEAEYYDWAGNQLNQDIRKKFYFCSSYNNWSFTNKFNHMDHKDAFNHLCEINNG